MNTNPEQVIPSKEPQSMTNTTENIDSSEELPLLMSSTIQQDNIQQDIIPINARTSEYDRKDKTCTKIMDETTLRIHFPAGFPNVDRPSLKSDNLSTITDITDISAHSKANSQQINIQGQNLLLITLFR